MVLVVLVLVLVALLIDGLRLVRPWGERRVRVDIVADQVRELFVVVSPVAYWPESCGAR